MSAEKTWYKGEAYDSDAWARWAVFFDTAGEEYRFGNKLTRLNNLPGFYLPTLGVFAVPVMDRPRPVSEFHRAVRAVESGEAKRVLFLPPELPEVVPMWEDGAGCNPMFPMLTKETGELSCFLAEFVPDMWVNTSGEVREKLGVIGYSELGIDIHECEYKYHSTRCREIEPVEPKKLVKHWWDCPADDGCDWLVLESWVFAAYEEARVHRFDDGLEHVPQRDPRWDYLSTLNRGLFVHFDSQGLNMDDTKIPKLVTEEAHKAIKGDLHYLNLDGTAETP